MPSRLVGKRDKLRSARRKLVTMRYMICRPTLGLRRRVGCSLFHAASLIGPRNNLWFEPQAWVAISEINNRSRHVVVTALVDTHAVGVRQTQQLDNGREYVGQASCWNAQRDTFTRSGLDAEPDVRSNSLAE